MALGWLRGASVPWAGGKPSTSNQLKGSPEPYDCQHYERPGECGTLHEMPGRAFWDCARLVKGWLGEEPKVGKDRDQGGFYLGCQQLERVECVCCGVHMSAHDH